MKLGQELRKPLSIYEKLRGKMRIDEIADILYELYLLKLFDEHAKAKHYEVLEKIGLDIALFNDSNFENLTYEELKAIINKIKESPLLEDIFVSLDHYESCPIDDELFKELMTAIQQIEFASALEKDKQSGSHEVGEAFLELIEKARQAQGKGADGITPISLRKLISGLNSKMNTTEIYDPVIGTGSLAIQVAVQNNIKTVFGQEIMPQAVRICKILLIAYGLVESAAYIKQGDTLINPLHVEENTLCKFKSIVAILPFGMTIEDRESIKNDPYKRYPERFTMRSGEMLFIYHILESLDKEGMASVLVSNGILFRGGPEGEMRQQLLKDNYIDCVIQLPGKMLEHTAIPTTLIVFKKKRNRSDILFIDLAGEVDKISKLTTQLSEETIEKTCELYHNYQNSHISQIVSIDEILGNDSNLNVKRYVIQEEEKQINLEKVTDTIEQLEKELTAIQAKIREKLR